MTVKRPEEYGFRRRCAWCGVVLRGWQLNRCRRCKAGGLDIPSPWTPSMSRVDAIPDERRRWR